MVGEVAGTRMRVEWWGCRILDGALPDAWGLLPFGDLPWAQQQLGWALWHQPQPAPSFLPPDPPLSITHCRKSLESP